MRGAWKKCQNIEGHWGERALDATPLRLASSSVAEENTSDISGKKFNLWRKSFENEFEKMGTNTVETNYFKKEQFIFIFQCCDGS